MDGGITWTSVSLSCGGVNGLTIKPSSPSIIFAATANGLYKSIDAGTTWGLVSGLNTTCYDVLFKANDDNSVFLLKQNGTIIEFLKSTDGGATFTVSMSGWAPINSNGGRMTVTSADPNRVYIVLLGVAPSLAVPHIYRSDDAGATWVLKCTGQTGLVGGIAMPLGLSTGQGYYDLDILANPNNANEIMVATTTAYKSIDGGATFNRFGGYGGSFDIHPDIQEMVASGNETWIATDGGMNYSSDFFTSTSNFSSRNNGLFGTDFWGFAQGWNEDVVAGGRYHNANICMFENYPAGNALKLGGGESATGYYMIGGTRKVAFSDYPNVAIPSTFSGTTTPFSFTKYPNQNSFGLDVSEVEFLPYCYNQVFLGKDKIFWKSKDGGITWAALYTFNDDVKKFEISRSNPDVIYLATNSGFYKSVNGGSDWATITLPSGASTKSMEIAVDFTNENIVWIASVYTSPGGVLKSTDGGVSWTNILYPSTFVGWAINLVHQAGTDGGIYVLNNGGYAYYRNNSMTNWVSYSSSLPVSIPVLSKPFYRDGKLRTAGTKGIWEVDFYEPSSPIAQPMVDKLSGTSCPADTFYFDSYSVLPQNAGTFSYLWSFPGASFVSSITDRNPTVVYDVPGSYTATLTVSNPNGTSTKALGTSIIVTPGINTPSTPSISQSGNVLISSAATGNQWYLNGTPIAGATNQTYTPTINENYSVALIANGCSSALSNTITITTLSIEDVETNPTGLLVFPNPNNGIVNVLFNAPETNTYQLELKNSLGQVVYQRTIADYMGLFSDKINLEKYQKGIYFLTLSSSKYFGVKKILLTN